MPFIANTPESLLGRSDSKNPNSTCRGLTASGRPCRRPLASPSSPTGSSSLLPPSRRPRTPDPRDEGLYCWQHKEQASLSAHSSPGPRATATPILEEGPRTSLDTLADRLGLVDLQDKEKLKKNKRKPRTTDHYSASAGHTGASSGRKKHEKAQLELCCCFTVPIEEKPVPARPQPQPVQYTASTKLPDHVRKTKKTAQLSNASPSKNSTKSTASETARIKDLIPNDLDTTTASSLLVELAKPLAESDEPGYIYMFWLAPDTISRSANGLPADAARAMLAPPSPSPRSRRVSDVVAPYADATTDGKNKTMVLKIGRAVNIQRRMNQWQRQCGRDVEVLRYYPYVPSSSSDVTAAAPPRMTPHARRVERLIHLELSGRGMRANRGTCSVCGKEHREWFEVGASRAAVREVDGIIRRWIKYDEGTW